MKAENIGNNILDLFASLLVIIEKDEEVPEQLDLNIEEAYQRMTVAAATNYFPWWALISQTLSYHSNNSILVCSVFLLVSFLQDI